MSASALSQEELARWMIRAVDVLMAVHTPPPEHPVALGPGNGFLVVNARRVPGGDMAPLSEHRQVDSEHPVVRRAVRVVARRAVFSNRRMLPQDGPTHLGVAAVA